MSKIPKESVTSSSSKKYVDGGVKTAAGGILSAFSAYDADGDGIITVDELLSLDKDGDGVVTQDEINEILKRMKALGNVPANAAQRIALLDQDMIKLRKKRVNLSTMLSKDEAIMERLKKDEDEAKKALKKLEDMYALHISEKKRILAALANAEKEMASFIKSVGQTTRKVGYEIAEHLQHDVSRSLTAERGYSTGTIHKQHFKSSSN